MLPMPRGGGIAASQPAGRVFVRIRPAMRPFPTPLYAYF